MKPWKHNLSLLLAVLTVLSLLLSACGPVAILAGYASNIKDRIHNQGSGNRNVNGTDHDLDEDASKITICHRTGSVKHPYVEISVSANAITDGHGTHEGDLIPAPESGCPATIVDTEGDDNSGDKITICHKTGSAKNPYVEITVSADATSEGHGTHEGDLIPAPEGGCPETVTSPNVP